MKTITDIWKLQRLLVQRETCYICDFGERNIFSIGLAPTATWHIRVYTRHTRFETYAAIYEYWSC